MKWSKKVLQLLLWRRYSSQSLEGTLRSRCGLLGQPLLNVQKLILYMMHACWLGCFQAALTTIWAETPAKWFHRPESNPKQSTWCHLLQRSLKDVQSHTDWSQYAYSILSLLTFIINDNHDASQYTAHPQRPSLTPAEWARGRSSVQCKGRTRPINHQQEEVLRVQDNTSVFFSDQLKDKLETLMMISKYMSDYHFWNLRSINVWGNG